MQPLNLITSTLRSLGYICHIITFVIELALTHTHAHTRLITITMIKTYAVDTDLIFFRHNSVVTAEELFENLAQKKKKEKRETLLNSISHAAFAMGSLF